MRTLPPDPTSDVERETTNALRNQQFEAEARGAEVIGFVVEASWAGGWDKITVPLTAERAAVHYRRLFERKHFQPRIIMEVREPVVYGFRYPDTPVPINEKD